MSDLVKPAYVKVSGQQKQVKNVYAKVSGSWKKITKAYTKVGGTWKVLWEPLTVGPLSFTQQVGYYCTLYYDGAGKIYTQSRDGAFNIETETYDLIGGDIGNILRYSFSTNGKYNMNISVSMSGRGGSSSLTINQSVRQPYGPVKFATVDTQSASRWYASNADQYSFTMSGEIL